MALRSYLVQIEWDGNLVIEIVTKLYCESSNKGWALTLGSIVPKED